MVAAKGCFLDGAPVRPLERVFRWEFGLLMQVPEPIAYFVRKIRDSDCAMLGGGARARDPSFQSECELLAIFLAVHVFSRVISHQRVQICVQSDSSSALEAVVHFKAHSPLGWLVRH